jgi:hypothetical protein
MTACFPAAPESIFARHTAVSTTAVFPPPVYDASTVPLPVSNRASETKAYCEKFRLILVAELTADE